MDESAALRNDSKVIKTLKQIVSYRLFGVIAALIVVIIIVSILSDKFMTYLNIMNILRQISIAGIAAFGVTFTVLLGGLDISIGSIQGVVGIAGSLVLVHTENPLLAFVFMLAIGLGVGLLNGVLITKVGIADIIVTIAMMFSLRGLTYLLTEAHSIQWTFKSWLNWLGTGHLGPVPTPVVMLFLTFFIFNFILKHTLLGRKIYAVGGDEEAARVAGIDIHRVRIIGYIISGVLASFAAVILAARLSSGQPNAGVGFEFRVIAGVLLGGVSLSGGEGDLFGTLIGVVFFGVLFNGLILLGVSSFWQQFLTGIIIIGAAWMDVRSRRRK